VSAAHGPNTDARRRDAARNRRWILLAALLEAVILGALVVLVILRR
jgi:hypothetical protein